MKNLFSFLSWKSGSTPSAGNLADSSHRTAIGFPARLIFFAQTDFQKKVQVQKTAGSLKPLDAKDQFKKDALNLSGKAFEETLKDSAGKDKPRNLYELLVKGLDSAGVSDVSKAAHQILRKLSRSGFETYQTYVGETFKLKDSKLTLVRGGKDWHTWDLSENDAQLKTKFKAEISADAKKQTRANLEFLQKEVTGYATAGLPDNIPAWRKGLIIELRSNSIVGVRRAIAKAMGKTTSKEIREFTGIEARRATWTSEVKPVQAQVITQFKATYPKTSYTATQLTAAFTDKYTGTTLQNLLFIEYYRLWEKGKVGEGGIEGPGGDEEDGGEGKIPEKLKGPGGDEEDGGEGRIPEKLKGPGGDEEEGGIGKIPDGEDEEGMSGPGGDDDSDGPGLGFIRSAMEGPGGDEEDGGKGFFREETVETGPGGEDEGGEGSFKEDEKGMSGPGGDEETGGKGGFRKVEKGMKGPGGDETEGYTGGAPGGMMQTQGGPQGPGGTDEGAPGGLRTTPEGQKGAGDTVDEGGAGFFRKTPGKTQGAGADTTGGVGSFKIKEKGMSGPGGYLSGPLGKLESKLRANQGQGADIGDGAEGNFVELREGMRGLGGDTIGGALSTTNQAPEKLTGTGKDTDGAPGGLRTTPEGQKGAGDTVDEGGAGFFRETPGKTQGAGADTTGGTGGIQEKEVKMDGSGGNEPGGKGNIEEQKGTPEGQKGLGEGIDSGASGGFGENLEKTQGLGTDTPGGAGSFDEVPERTQGSGSDITGGSGNLQETPSKLQGQGDDTADSAAGTLQENIGGSGADQGAAQGGITEAPKSQTGTGFDDDTSASGQFTDQEAGLSGVGDSESGALETSGLRFPIPPLTKTTTAAIQSGEYNLHNPADLGKFVVEEILFRPDNVQVVYSPQLEQAADQVGDKDIVHSYSVTDKTGKKNLGIFSLKADGSVRIDKKTGTGQLELVGDNLDLNNNSATNYTKIKNLLDSLTE